MTKKERRNPDLLQASRKRRIAAGAGLEVQELNRLLKMHRQMADVMKKMGGMGKKGLLRGGLGALFGKGAGRHAPACPHRPMPRPPAGLGAAARPLRPRPQEMTAIPVLATERLLLRAPAARGFRALRRLLRLRAQRLGGRPDLAAPPPGPSSPPPPAAGCCTASAPSRSRSGRAAAISARSASTGPRTYPEPEIGWILTAGAEGRGFAEEAARAVRAWAYGTRGIATLVSYIAPGNWRSIRLAERLGAVADPDAQSCGPDAAVWRHPGPGAPA